MIHIATGILILSLTLVALAAVAFVLPDVANVAKSFLTTTCIAPAVSITLVLRVRRDRL